MVGRSIVTNIWIINPQGWVMHACVGKLSHYLTCLLSIGLSWTNFSEISIVILIFSFQKMCLKMLSAKWQPFGLCLNVFKYISRCGMQQVLHWKWKTIRYCKAKSWRSWDKKTTTKQQTDNYINWSIYMHANHIENLVISAEILIITTN